jgi:hypothetical protein
LAAVGTVAANVSAGWPNAVAVGLHGAAPLMLLAMVEAARAVLLRRAGLASGVVRDRIPSWRWVLSPWSTWGLWRRMVLWQITSYRLALEMESKLCRARTLLRMRYGRRWRHEAPADVVWMLGVDVFAEEACARVDALVGSAEDAAKAVVLPVGADVSSGNVEDPEGAVVGGQAVGTMGDDGQLDEAMKLNERHWVERNRPVSAETLRKHLHVGASRARELTYFVRAMDKAMLGDGVSVGP